MKIIFANSTKSPNKVIDDDEREEWSLQLTEGSARITLLKSTGEKLDSTKYGHKKVCTANLYLETDSQRVLDKAISIGRRPYWAIEMLLFDSLNLETILELPRRWGRI